MNAQIYSVVKEIIDAWDPMRFFPVAPPDEYEGEINCICKELESNFSLQEENSIEKFAEFIGDLCDSTDRYYSQEKYIEIAKKIIDSMHSIQ